MEGRDEPIKLLTLEGSLSICPPAGPLFPNGPSFQMGSAVLRTWKQVDVLIME